jgi:hypothetical protein
VVEGHYEWGLSFLCVGGATQGCASGDGAS